jgi:hypothetical protein
MNRFTHIFGANALILALAMAGAQMARAGRIGGPATETITLGAFQSSSVNVPFAANAPAVVTLSGVDAANAELFVSDADGHMTQATVVGNHKVATINVYRAGTFNVGVRNTSPMVITVTVSTN